MRILLLTLALLIAPPTIPAQSTAASPTPTSLAGNYTTDLGSMHATLHIHVDSEGQLSCSLDDQSRAAWVHCETIRLNGRILAFAIPALHAKWQGTVSADGTQLIGTWDQPSNASLITFTREVFHPNPHPTPIDGIWLAPPPSGETERTQIVIKSDTAGREYCVLDRPDHYTMGIECTNIQYRGNNLSFDLPLFGAHFEGQLSADTQSLPGDISQKSTTGQTYTSHFVFTRQAVALTGDPPKPRYDPAIPAVSAEDLQSVLDRDLAVALQSGELSPDKNAGVVIAVLNHGVTRPFAYGKAQPDSIFEIGAFSKVFTGLLLAQMVEQDEVRFDQPVRELLPGGTVPRPAGEELTLLDLATQRGGLPPMPDNINLNNLENPYANYHPADLFAWIAKHGVARKADGAYSFTGGLGFALLGQALAAKSGITYADLLNQQILGPLQLTDTAITLSPAQQPRLIQGHDEYHNPVHSWDTDALAPTVGLRSTAADLLHFLAANLHPESLRSQPLPAAKTLPAALAASHHIYTQGTGNTRIALGWFYEPETGNYWHNGATMSHSVYAFFNPKGDYAAVVLLNTSPGARGAFVERLGQHISQRFAGEPALNLDR